MTARRRIPLNPCDCCIFAHHRLLLRQRRGGNIAFMMVDLAGWIDPCVVRAALEAAMAAHPITVSPLRISPLRFRPYWQAPSSPPSAAKIAAERAYAYDDFRAADDGVARMERLCMQRYVPDWEIARGPQVRLEHYALPGERTRLCLRWPHFLMDAEGAQTFLSELEQRRESSIRPHESAADDRPVDVLAGKPRRQRWRLARSGLIESQPLAAAGPNTLHNELTRCDFYRVLNRSWQGQELDEIRDRAKAVTPAGPALYGRFLAAVVLRALDRLYREEGVHAHSLAITFPMRVQWPDVAMVRPLTGNYVVSPTITIARETVADMAALGAEIQKQVQQFLARRGDAAQWALLEAASLVHAWFYPLIFRRFFTAATYSSGFSYYGEIESPLRRLAGADVLNIWGGGPTTTPPGWNPVFSRYGDRLNLSLTWTPPAITDEMAERYASAIEKGLFEAS